MILYIVGARKMKDLDSNNGPDFDRDIYSNKVNQNDELLRLNYEIVDPLTNDIKGYAYGLVCGKHDAITSIYFSVKDRVDINSSGKLALPHDIHDLLIISTNPKEFPLGKYFHVDNTNMYVYTRDIKLLSLAKQFFCNAMISFMNEDDQEYIQLNSILN